MSGTGSAIDGVVSDLLSAGYDPNANSLSWATGDIVTLEDGSTWAVFDGIAIPWEGPIHVDNTGPWTGTARPGFEFCGCDDGIVPMIYTRGQRLHGHHH